MSKDLKYFPDRHGASSMCNVCSFLICTVFSTNLKEGQGTFLRGYMLQYEYSSIDVVFVIRSTGVLNAFLSRRERLGCCRNPLTLLNRFPLRAPCLNC